MKQTQNLVNSLAACAIALAMVSSLTAQTAGERIAKVVRVKGAARYSTGGNVWQPVEAGTRLKAGAIVQTAADSYVDIVLDETETVSPFSVPNVVSGPASGGGVAYQPVADQNVVRVFADSVLAIDKLTRMDTGADQVTETLLDLRSGKIFGSVKKLSAASRYEVKIPNGVAGIRGTSYTISADGIISVFSGSVIISYIGANGDPVTQVVMGGFEFNTHTGQISPITTEQKEKPQLQIEEGVLDHTIYYVAPVNGSVSPH